jgi:hypothetical protein
MLSAFVTFDLGIFERLPVSLSVGEPGDVFAHDFFHAGIGKLRWARVTSRHLDTPRIRYGRRDFLYASVNGRCASVILGPSWFFGFFQLRPAARSRLVLHLT